MQTLYLCALPSIYLVPFSNKGKLAIKTTLGKVSTSGTSSKYIFSTWTIHKLYFKFFFSGWIQVISIFFLTISYPILWFQKSFDIQHLAYLAACQFSDQKNIFVGNLFKPSLCIGVWNKVYLFINICNQSHCILCSIY